MYPIIQIEIDSVVKEAWIFPPSETFFLLYNSWGKQAASLSS